jgi:hypothetical protein
LDCIIRWMTRLQVLLGALKLFAHSEILHRTNCSVLLGHFLCSFSAKNKVWREMPVKHGCCYDPCLDQSCPELLLINYVEYIRMISQEFMNGLVLSFTINHLRDQKS